MLVSLPSLLPSYKTGLPLRSNWFLFNLTRRKFFLFDFFLIFLLQSSLRISMHSNTSLGFSFQFRFKHFQCSLIVSDYDPCYIFKILSNEYLIFSVAQFFTTKISTQVLGSSSSLSSYSLLFHHLLSFISSITSLHFLYPIKCHCFYYYPIGPAVPKLANL